MVAFTFFDPENQQQLPWLPWRIFGPFFWQRGLAFAGQFLGGVVGYILVAHEATDVVGVEFR
jgi:prolipoprotein diacylglyceryltransferase